MIKKLFTTEELKSNGFTEATEGGFRYLLLELPSGVTLVTGDVEDTGDELPEDEFHRVYDLSNLKTQLSDEQVKALIYGEGQ